MSDPRDLPWAAGSYRRLPDGSLVQEPDPGDAPAPAPAKPAKEKR